MNRRSFEKTKQKVIASGYPVDRGPGRLGSISDFYVGNGGEVVFG
jgi:hypothetical protein